MGVVGVCVCARVRVYFGILTCIHVYVRLSADKSGL